MCNQDPQSPSPAFTPAPDGPIPLPGQPGWPEIPDLPFPQWPTPIPPDFWRCFRIGPVSGRYEATTFLAPGADLVLRVDIDERASHSPVMNRLSGDFYRLSRIRSGLFTFFTYAYVESWIVEAPAVSWRRCSVEITGTVKFWKGTHPPTTIRVTIRWGRFSGVGPAEVVFFENGVQRRDFTCHLKSRNFRDVALEVDVCDSVDAAPLLPSYDTLWHDNRPADLPGRVVTIEGAYAEAGVGVTISPTHTVIDDSAAGFSSWSVAELHDAMETHFSQHAGVWPKWKMWGLLAGSYDNSGTGGIMFDYWGAAEPPERQGFAVFRNHSWFDDLRDGAPTTQDEAWAMRHFLYTYVHEAGHGFNYVHSWDKSRPSSLSWMNYDWKYDDINGVDQFWANFRFRFDDEELIHLRHGDRDSVIMGGDAWASGNHLEGAAESYPSPGEEPAALEFLVRARRYFEWLEPVQVELRLRNCTPGRPIEIDARLQPEQENVLVLIRKPHGEVVEYRPVVRLLETPRLRSLEPAATDATGDDRHSESVALTFGGGGFYFDEPGEYRVRAIYRGLGDLVLPSNTVRFRVGMPVSKEADRLAGDYFTGKVGMSLYLGGSASPHLAAGMDVLRRVAEEHSGSLLGAQAAMAVAAAERRSFYRLDGAALKKSHSADPREALKLSEPAMAVFKEETHPRLNIAHRQLAEDRAASWVALGEPDRAAGELAAMGRALEARGVKRRVLEEIRAGLPDAPGPQRKRTASAPKPKAARRRARR